MNQPHEHSNGCCSGSVNRYQHPVTLKTIAKDAQVSLVAARASHRKYFRASANARKETVPPILAGMLWEELVD